PRQWLRDRGLDLARRRGKSRDVTVDEFESVIRTKGRATSQEFVEDDAKRIQVGAVIHQAVHATGLFWRQIWQRAVQERKVQRHLRLAGSACSEAEVGETDFPGGGVPQDTPGVEVLMNNIAPMQLGQNGHELNRQREEGLQVTLVCGEQGM